MSSRVTQTNATPSGPITTPKHVSTAQLTLAGVSGHTLEKWGDGTYWDTTSSKAVCVDKLGLTGTPRFQD